MVMLSFSGAAMSVDIDVSEKAKKLGQDFFELSDRQEYNRTYELLAPQIKAIKPQAMWVGRMTSERGSMGAVSSRSLSGAEKVSRHADLAKGNYLKLTYDVVFTNQPEAKEILVLMPLKDGQFGIAGYLVEYNRWPEAIKIMVNGLFLVFFIMSLLAFITWAMGKVIQKLENSNQEKE